MNILKKIQLPSSSGDCRTAAATPSLLIRWGKKGETLRWKNIQQGNIAYFSLIIILVSK